MVAGCKRWAVRFLWAIFWIAMLILSYFTFPVSVPFWTTFAFWKLFRWSKLGFAPAWLRVAMFLISSGGFVPLWANLVNSTGMAMQLVTQVTERQLEAVNNVADSLGWIVVTSTPSVSAQSAVQAIQATSVPNTCPELAVYAPGTVAKVIYAGGVNVRNGPGQSYTQLETLLQGAEIPAYARTRQMYEGFFWIVLDDQCTRWVLYHDGAGTEALEIASP